MNRGVLWKSLREVLPVTVVSGGALFAVVALLAYVLPTFQEDLIGKLWQIDFVKNLVRATLGADVGDQFGPEIAGAFAWSHPIVIMLVVAHGIVVCTRVPAAEVERGTIDLLLGLPVSRGQVFVTESLVWVGSTLVTVVCALLGHLVGVALAGATAPPMEWQRIPIAVNLCALSFAFGAIAALVAAHSDRRGKAMAVALAIVVPAFLLNYLRQFWAPADLLSLLSPLRYYNPFFVMRSGGVPVLDVVILLGIAIVVWLAAARQFARRDLCTT